MSLNESLSDSQSNVNSRNKQTVVFDQSKNPLFTINDDLRSFSRRIKLSGFRVFVNKDEINGQVLNSAHVYILIAPQAPYKETEFALLKRYVDKGGKLWVLLSEGGEKKLQTNINFLLEQYSISVNNDSVLRAYYYKYSHPKEALVDHGLLNRGLLRLVDTIHNAYSVSQEPRVQGTFDSTSIDTGKIDSNTGSESESESLCFLYPFGATLNVAAPAIALLSTGSTCIPANRPICALHRSASSSGDSGALLVLGSVHMFSDSYVMLEQNQLTLEMLMQTLLQPQLPLNTVDALNPELNEYHNLPEVALLANRPIGCMHESEPLPADISKLILAPSTRSLSWINTSAATSIGNNQRSLFQFDNAGYWSVLNTYDQLQVDHEPLRLIRPMFEAPLPPLQPAVLAPAFRGLHRPALELFDLESEFSSVQSRLAQLAAECTDDHISYFLAECGRLFGLPHTSQPKLMLEQVFKQIIQYKKIS